MDCLLGHYGGHDYDADDAMGTILVLSLVQLMLTSGATLGAYRVKCNGCKRFPGRLGDYTSIFNYIERRVLVSMRTDKIRSVYSIAGRYNVIILRSEAPKACARKSRWGVPCCFAVASKTLKGTRIEMPSASKSPPPSLKQKQLPSRSVDYAHDFEAVEILSGGQVALRALQAVKFNPKVVLGCHKRLQQLAEHRSVTLRWVLSYSGIKGNAIADFLARGVSGRRFSGPEPRYGSIYGC
ncbi:hypothetical protein Trydic_g13748 [Trypoxylus dichotomus]